MRIFYTLLLLVLVQIGAKGQLWFDLGVKGAYGPTIMYDQNVFDRNDYKHKLTAGHSFGGRLGVNFGYHAGISLEYNLATSKQTFNFFEERDNTFKWKHNDLAALFRWSGNGAYVEAGGKYSIMNKVERDNVSLGVIDDTENFEKNYLSGIFGFGSYLMGSELLTVNLGIRLHWAFTDMVNEVGKAGNYPIVRLPLEDPTKKTLATAAQLQLEINYAFGHFAKEGCHDRWKLILFQ